MRVSHVDTETVIIQQNTVYKAEFNKAVAALRTKLLADVPALVPYKDIFQTLTCVHPDGLFCMDESDSTRLCFWFNRTGSSMDDRMFMLRDGVTFRMSLQPNSFSQRARELYQVMIDNKVDIQLKTLDINKALE